MRLRLRRVAHSTLPGCHVGVGMQAIHWHVTVSPPIGCM